MSDPAVLDDHPALLAEGAGAARDRSARPRGADFLALAKPRLNFLVVLTTLTAYYLGTEGAELAPLLHTVVGTSLVAGGASAFNQVIERDSDRLMRRTTARPLPSGRLDARRATWFAAALSLAGLVELAVGVNLMASAVALATLASYIAVYTPLKRVTPLSTLVGGVPGALPAVIGWAAARGSLSIEAWVLFGIVFLWQMPHFLAIAWLYRDDYARAGLPVLPVVAPDGASTAAQAVLYASTLVPVSLAASLVGLAGPVYFAGALLAGLGYVGLGIRFARSRTNVAARRLFFGSIGYLPIVLALLAADHR